MKEFVRRIIVWILTLEARGVISKYHPKVMVVTGSVGKTSAKDAAYTALKSHTFVRKSEKSYNSDIGVPLTVLGVPNGWGNMITWVRNMVDGAILLVTSAPYPRWLIVEVGADRPGDISRSLSWLKPDVVIATRFPAVPVHVEFYTSPEEVVAEELYPVSRLGANGVAVVNIDDPIGAAVAVPDGARRITYGFDEGADVRGLKFRATIKEGMPSGISFDITYTGERVHLAIPGVLGVGHAYSALAGIAGALAAGATLTEAAAPFNEHVPPPGRMRLIAGVNNSVLIDDTYNSSPVAAEEALKALKDAPVKGLPAGRQGRRIAVMADMLELGSYSAGEHEHIGAVASESADILVTVGVRAKGIADGMRKSGKGEDIIRSFERGPEAGSFLLTIVKEGDLVLIKGSQSLRMERVVKALMAEPERARELLCRQDAEWLAR